MMPTHAGNNFGPLTGFSGQTSPQPLLKPCPFCGKDVELRHFKASGYDWWYVVCNRCEIAVDPLMWNTGRTKEEAIAIWNRRVSE